MRLRCAYNSPRCAQIDRKFFLIIAGLDNIAARRWMNATLHDMVDRTSGEPDPSSLTQLSRSGWCESRHRMWHSVADSIASAESTFRYHHPTDWWWHGGLQGSGSSDHSNDDLVLRLFTGCFPTTGPDGIWQNQMYSSWRFNSTSAFSMISREDWNDILWWESFNQF